MKTRKECSIVGNQLVIREIKKDYNGKVSEQSYILGRVIFKEGDFALIEKDFNETSHKLYSMSDAVLHGEFQNLDLARKVAKGLSQ